MKFGPCAPPLAGHLPARISRSLHDLRRKKSTRAGQEALGAGSAQVLAPEMLQTVDSLAVGDGTSRVLALVRGRHWPKRALRHSLVLARRSLSSFCYFTQSAASSSRSAMSPSWSGCCTHLLTDRPSDLHASVVAATDSRPLH